ncbi:RCC1 domain-containing protein [Kutzneria sp. NPDC052558]|uniref:RCC1 domain-containing protein n=1 Tax=Kutzneria sp. NPDC052558 TaxID=3364121 RepID=UPI0037C8F493
MGDGNGFVAVGPQRVLDTRVSGGPVGSDGVRVLDLAGKVPSEARAVVLNLTGTDVTAATNVTVWPDGAARPVASNLNLERGQTAANLVTVQVGAGGKVDLYNHAGSVNLVADLAGYYAPSDGVGFTALTPVRALDTRVSGGKVGPDSSRVLDLAGKVPAGAKAVVLNLTGTDTSAETYVSVWPDGQARPAASALNLGRGETRPNLVTVQVGAGGKIDLYNHAGSVHLIVDVAGYYSAESVATFSPLSPARVLDTRRQWTDQYGALGPNATKTLDLAGRVPVRATAVVANLTGTNPTASTYVAAYPGGTTRDPNGPSNLNLVAGQTSPNLAVVSVSGDAKLNLYNHSGSVDLIVDLAGYFAPRTTQCVNGCVYSWGDNAEGQLGQRSYGGATQHPSGVFGLTDVTSIGTNGPEGFAVRADGTLWAWGQNDSGNWSQCLDEAMKYTSMCVQNAPVRVGAPEGVRAVVPSALDWEMYALLDSGQVWVSYGVENYTDEPRGGSHYVDGFRNVTALAGGRVNNYALKTDGTVWGVGSDDDGNLGNGVCQSGFCEVRKPVQVQGLTDVVSVAGGDGQGYAVKSDGTVWVWGHDAKGLSGGSGNAYTPVQIPGLSNVVSVAAHENYGLALRADGTVWAWGNNKYGTLGNGSRDDAWQYSVSQVPGLSGVTSVTAGLSEAYAVKSDGTVWAWGQSATHPTQVPGLTGVAKVAADRLDHAYALVPHQG